MLKMEGGCVVNFHGVAIQIYLFLSTFNHGAYCILEHIVKFGSGSLPCIFLRSCEVQMMLRQVLGLKRDWVAFVDSLAIYGGGLVR